MKSYIISYDLISKKDYQKLIDEIKSYQDAAHVHESVWIVKYVPQGSTGSIEIRDDLIKFIDSDDRIFVAELTGSAAWKGDIDGGEAVKNAL